LSNEGYQVQTLQNQEEIEQFLAMTNQQVVSPYDLILLGDHKK
jgi:hypothetical protein